MVKQKITQNEFFAGKQKTHAPPTIKAQPDPMIENIKRIDLSFSKGMSVGNKPRQKRKSHVDRGFSRDSGGAARTQNPNSQHSYYSFKCIKTVVYWHFSE